MPLSPLITFYTPDGKPLPGPVDIFDPDTPGFTGCYCEEFQHCVYTIQKDYFYALLFGVDFVRKHEPMTIVKQHDKIGISLTQRFKIENKKEKTTHAIYAAHFMRLRELECHE